MPGVGTNRYADAGNDPINFSDPGGNGFFGDVKQSISDSWNAFKDSVSGNYEDAGGNPEDGAYGYAHYNGQTYGCYGCSGTSVSDGHDRVERAQRYERASRQNGVGTEEYDVAHGTWNPSDQDLINFGAQVLGMTIFLVDPYLYYHLSGSSGGADDGDETELGGISVRPHPDGPAKAGKKPQYIPADGGHGPEQAIEDFEEAVGGSWVDIGEVKNLELAQMER